MKGSILLQTKQALFGAAVEVEEELLEAAKTKDYTRFLHKDAAVFRFAHRAVCSFAESMAGFEVPSGENEIGLLLASCREDLRRRVGQLADEAISRDLKAANLLKKIRKEKWDQKQWDEWRKGVEKEMAPPVPIITSIAAGLFVGIPTPDDPLEAPDLDADLPVDGPWAESRPRAAQPFRIVVCGELGVCDSRFFATFARRARPEAFEVSRSEIIPWDVQYWTRYDRRDGKAEPRAYIVVGDLEGAVRSFGLPTGARIVRVRMGKEPEERSDEWCSNFFVDLNGRGTEMALRAAWMISSHGKRDDPAVHWDLSRDQRKIELGRECTSTYGHVLVGKAEIDGKEFFYPMRSKQRGVDIVLSNGCDDVGGFFGVSFPHIVTLNVAALDSDRQICPGAFTGCRIERLVASSSFFTLKARTTWTWFDREHRRAAAFRGTAWNPSSVLISAPKVMSHRELLNGRDPLAITEVSGDLIFPKMTETLSPFKNLAFVDWFDARDGTHPGKLDPAPVLTIPLECLREARSLKRVCLPRGLEKIGSGAFQQCTSLESVEVPPSLKTISDNAFCGCLSLVEFRAGDKLDSVGRSAFRECESLKYFIQKRRGGIASVGEGTPGVYIAARTVGQRAFYRCQELRAVWCQDSVGTIGEEAFLQCRQLNRVWLPKDCDIRTNILKDCNGVSQLFASGLRPYDSSVKLGLQHSVQVVLREDLETRDLDNLLTFVSKVLRKERCVVGRGAVVGKTIFVQGEVKRQILIEEQLESENWG